MANFIFLTCKLSKAVEENLASRLQNPDVRAWVAACPFNTGPDTQYDALRAKFPKQLHKITTPHTAATILPIAAWLKTRGVALNFTVDNYRVKCATELLQIFEGKIPADGVEKLPKEVVENISKHMRQVLTLLDEKKTGQEFYTQMAKTVGCSLEEYGNYLNFNNPKCLGYKLPELTVKGKAYVIGREYGKAMMAAGPSGALLDIFATLVFLQYMNNGGGYMHVLHDDVELKMEEVEAAVAGFTNFVGNNVKKLFPSPIELWMDGEADDWAARDLCNQFVNLETTFYVATTRKEETKDEKGNKIITEHSGDLSLYVYVMAHMRQLGVQHVVQDPETNFKEVHNAVYAQLVATQHKVI